MASYERTKFLAHHGILGQKWGIRRFQNPDGSLTDAGKKRYGKEATRKIPKIKKIFKESAYDYDKRIQIADKVFDELHLDKNYLTVGKKIAQSHAAYQKQLSEKSDEFFDELENGDYLHKYEAASEFSILAQHTKKPIKEHTIEELAEYGFHAVLDDGQQDPINAYSMFAALNNREQEVSSIFQAADSERREARDRIDNVFTMALKEIGAENLYTYHSKYPGILPDSTLAKRMAENMIWGIEDTDSANNSRGYWNFDMAAGVYAITNRDKKNMKDALSYVSKINNSNEPNTWRYLNEAVARLNLSSTQLQDLSPSDWDRINKEIAKVKQ